MGMFADALRKQLHERVPNMLQALRDDRSGKMRLKKTQRDGTMALLRKVMTEAQIEAELAKNYEAVPTSF